MERLGAEPTSRRDVAILACAPGDVDKLNGMELIEIGTARLMCGVFGIYAPDRDVARLTHSACTRSSTAGRRRPGIAVSENGRLTVLQELGLITNFSKQKLRGLRGEAAIGHTRYSTTGSSTWANAQPLLPRGNRTVALAHNGNLAQRQRAARASLRPKARGSARPPTRS